MATRTVDLELLKKIDVLLENYRKFLLDLGVSKGLKLYDNIVQIASELRVEIHAP